MRFFGRRVERAVAIPATEKTPPQLLIRPWTVPAAAMRLNDLHFCVVDVETTGLSPGYDRVVELAVVRLDARGQTVDEWHTLINPRRSMDAELIHGISDAMVADAPPFESVANQLLTSLHGAVLVGHNAAFDRQFVHAELDAAGRPVQLPYLCTMSLRRRVGMRAPVAHRLPWACWQSAVPIGQAHAAINDARATACLFAGYLAAARRGGLETFGDLAKTAAVHQASSHPVLTISGERTPVALRPRTTAASPAAPPADGSSYLGALAEAVADFVLDGHEVDRLHRLVVELGMSAEQVTQAHHAFIEERFGEYMDDDELSWEEFEQLRLLARVLAVDPRWLATLVDEVRPRHQALTLPAVSEPGPNDAAAQPPLSVCFTGPFEAMPLTRAEVQELAADAGMIVKPGVSKGLDVLVCADPDAGTSKLAKAEQVGTVLVDQETFLALAGVTTPSPNPATAVLSAVWARRRERAAPKADRKTGTAPARPASVVVTADPSVVMHELWCDVGDHFWTRPAQRGRPPKRCPEHAQP